jgi:two-component system, LytTR family, response regulator
LLKPIATEDVEIVIKKFKNNEMDTTKSQAQNLHVFNNKRMQDTIALSTQQGLLFVKMDDIMYLEADSCYTKIWMKDKTKYIASKTLAAFEEVLQDNAIFFRPHKSYIVNLQCIKQYIRGEGGELMMLDGVSIAVSRNKKQEFLNLFMKV